MKPVIDWIANGKVIIVIHSSTTHPSLVKSVIVFL